MENRTLKRKNLIFTTFYLLLFLMSTLAAEEGAVVFQSVNFPGHFITSQGKFCLIKEIKTKQDEEEALFRIIPGLADSEMISIESVKHPGFYIANNGQQVTLEANTGQADFPARATFSASTVLIKSRAQNLISLEAQNKQKHFVRHSNNYLYLSLQDGSDILEKDGTFRIVKQGEIASIVQKAKNSIQGKPTDLVSTEATKSSRAKMLTLMTLILLAVVLIGINVFLIQYRHKKSENNF